jgi:hypothetical protein
MKKKLTKSQKKGAKIMHEWGQHTLNIGKSKKLVPHTKTGQRQAIAIMLSQMGKSKKKK